MENGVSTQPSGSSQPDTQSTLEASPQRITQQDVEKAEAEKEAAMTKLMDEMEASVHKQGQYFVSIGQKKPIIEVRPITTSKFLGLGSKTTDQEQTVGYQDDRALILKTPVKQDPNITRAGERLDFLVATKHGIFRASFWQSEIDNPQSGAAKESKRRFDSLTALIAGTLPVTDSWKYTSLLEESPYARPRITGPDFIIIDLNKNNVDILATDFQTAVTESIKKTESPYKKQAEEAQQGIQLATNATSMIQSLPPRE